MGITGGHELRDVGIGNETVLCKSSKYFSSVPIVFFSSQSSSLFLVINFHTKSKTLVLYNTIESICSAGSVYRT